MQNLALSALGSLLPRPSEVQCPYCNQGATLVTGAVIYRGRPDLAGLKFWQCAPCAAYVGCHAAGNGYGDGTRPLGILANAMLRSAKKAAHASFDGIWKDGHMPRKAAYRWLAKEMGLEEAHCHIGMFTVEQCRKAKTVCTEWWARAI